MSVVIYNRAKRFFDLLIASVALLFMLPIGVVAMVFVKLESDGPIFFTQTRVGLKQREFELLKFRTMVVNDQRDFGKDLDSIDPEITVGGRYLRRFKVDELPQLLNVLAGEMSLVGPRPPLPLLLSEMSEKDKVRFDVVPGLTGLAQVNGNIHLSWPERFQYDLEYVRTRSLSLDIRILLKTVLIVIFGEGRFVKRRKSR